ncbi:MAG: tol-pal system-associated acyl-CoA thioesterase [Gammaproteobacteria bacterium]
MTEFIWPVRVYYEDTDSGGVVYYANYLRFMERARTEWLRSLGFEQDELLKRDNILFAVRSVSLDYFKPARFNDRLLVSASIYTRGHASLGFEQNVRRAGDENTVLCAGQIRIACLAADSFRPQPIPPHILTELPDVR